MEKPRHILITGSIGIGKSTLIRKLLRRTEKPVYGFLTLKMPCPGEDTMPLYMFPASLPTKQRRCAEDNLLGLCGAGKERHPEVFDCLGVRLIREARADGVILMDELGFMESEAKAFQGAVLEALHGDIPVIASLKSRPGVPFLEQVRRCPDTVIYTVTRENRDGLEAEIMAKERRFFL